MKTIRIFIASSEELYDDRNVISLFIEQLNEIYQSKGLQFKVVRWENLNPAYEGVRKQSEYNDKVRNSQLFIALFYHKVGMFTLEELSVAQESLKETGSPAICFYIKSLRVGEEEKEEMRLLKDRILNEMKHFIEKPYSHPDSLKLNIVLQLQRLENGNVIQAKAEEDKIMVDSICIGSLNNISFANRNKVFRQISDTIEYLQNELIMLRNDEKDLEEDVQDLKSNDIQTERLQRKQDRLDEVRKRIADLMLRLKKQKYELNMQSKSLLNTAIQINQFSIDNQTYRLRTAIDLFEKGETEAADALLDFDEIADEAHKHISDIHLGAKLMEESIKALKVNIYQLLLKAKNLRNNRRSHDQTEQIDTIYKQVVKLISEIPDENFRAMTIYEIARSYQSWEYNAEAIKYYVKALDCYQKIALSPEGEEKLVETQIMIATIKNNWAYLLKSTNRNSSRVEDLYKDSLGIYAMLSEKFDEIYRLDLAQVLNNLAGYYQQEHRMADARLTWKEALEIYKNVSHKLNKRDWVTIASIKNNLAGIYARTHNRKKEGEMLYNSSLDIYTSLLDESNGDAFYLQEMAKIKNNLATLYVEMKRYGEAEILYSDALGLYNKMKGQEQTFNETHIAWTQCNMGYLYKKEKRYDEAASFYEKAIEIYNSYVCWDEAIYLPQLAWAKACYGGIYYYTHKDKEKYEALYQEALNIYQKISDENNYTYLPDIASIQNNLAILYKRNNDLLHAYELYSKALENYRLLDEKNPGVFTQAIEVIRSNMNALK